MANEANRAESQPGPAGVTIDVATSEELPAVGRLLSACGLSPDGAWRGTRTLLVARDGARAIGTVALENFGRAALLRGLAVARASRGCGLGSRLCRVVLERACLRGVERVYLLTTDAERFFARLGFVRCERASAPPDLAASSQFTGDVCATATCMSVELPARRALQDHYPGSHCFGCGAGNPNGLRLKSHRVGAEYVAHFVPSPAHNAGPRAWLNGGIAATLVDCHSVFAALADAYESEGRPFAAPPMLWYVTGSLALRYERPTPIDAELSLSARIVSATPRKTTVECTLSAGGHTCVRATLVAVRVPDAWWGGAPGPPGPSPCTIPVD